MRCQGITHEIGVLTTSIIHTVRRSHYSSDWTFDHAYYSCGAKALLLLLFFLSPLLLIRRSKGITHAIGLLTTRITHTVRQRHCTCDWTFDHAHYSCGAK